MTSPASRRLSLVAGAVISLGLVFAGAVAPVSAEDTGGYGTPDTAPVTVIIPKSTTPAVVPPAAPAAGSGAAAGAATTSSTSAGSPAQTCSIGEDGSPVVPGSAATTANTLLADRAAYAPGDTVAVSSGGFTATQPVRAMVFSSPAVVTDTVADDAGSATYAFDIPADTPSGELSVQLVGWNCGYVAAVTVLVGDATAAASSGVPLWWWLLIIGGLAAIATTLAIIGGSRGWFARPGAWAARA